MSWVALRSVIKGVLRSTVALLGSAQRRSEGPRVLCYHGVTEQPSDEWSVTPAQLREQMTIVQGEGNPVALPQLISWLLDGGSLPERAIAITFDDGYLDVLERAAPILDQRRIPGTAFVISGLVDGQSSDVSYQPSRPLMTWPQISALAASGWTIGAHTLSHPVLAQQTREESLWQLLESRRRIGEVLGQPIALLAYPYGTRQTVSSREWALAEEAGYRAAFLDAIGAVRRGQDRFALPRCKVLGSDSLRVFRASLSGGLDPWRHVEDR
jgi:peptidoglycan/xylan/chitin deacetylase (PgdA/CDA1 family)